MMKSTLICLAWLLLITGAISAEIETQSYDLTLADCLAQTFRNNPDIQTLRADVERAAGDKLVYSSRLLPQLATQVQAGQEYGSLYPQNGMFSTLTAQLSQPLIDVGIPPALRRGRLEVALAGQTFYRETTDRLNKARNTFVHALYIRDLLALSNEIMQHLQANVTSAQQRLDAGLGTRVAVAQAQVQALNLARDLASLSNEYFSTTTQLAELTGNNFNVPTNHVILPRPVGTLVYRPITIDLPAETAYALEHRADIGFLRTLVASAIADEQIVTADFFPRLTLEADLLFIPNSVLLTKQTQLVAGQSMLATEERAGVGLTWRVIDNGQVIGARRRLDAIRQEYILTLHKLEEAVPRELAEIAGALQTAVAQHDAFVKSVAAAAENLKLIEARLALGQATQLDFLNAQSDLLGVSAGLINAVATHEVARNDFDHATGRYLEFYISAPK